MSTFETTTYTPIGGVLGMSRASNVTVLAQRLMPPPKPAMRNLEAAVGINAFLVVLIPGCMLYTIVAVALGLEASVPVENAIGLVLFLVLAVVPGIPNWRRITDSAGRALTEADRKNQQLWSQKTARWQRLFYCSRCDGIFIPGKDQFVPADQMNAFL